ncbi:hypothetical protein C1I93_14540 [Micromonospora endophytica]|uniref:Uncharacterized protein n=1 Tax=Micromonospora endophytica TaxID=515350 RepID=A0A2W2D619_9ACTN|nr:hypothetical protein C1I93_14540 [Micromonospora endophytica]RIW46659.1 hypothetical protein D3H59_12070 [Micromonospora endophytica]
MVAVVATLATVWLLAALLTGRRQDLLGVAMALLCVLCGTVAGVAVAAARQRGTESPAPDHTVGAADTEPPNIDADTLETLGDREAVRALRERYRDSGAG